VPTIITATQLRSVLGVSSSLFNDDYLNQIIDSAEAVVLPMLVSYSAPIGGLQLISNEAYVYTVGRHVFNDEQSVVISGCGAPYDGTHTVKSVNLDTFAVTSVGLVTPQVFREGLAAPRTMFTFDLTNANVNFKEVIPSGKAALSGAATYVGNDAVESAIYVVSTEIFQSRTAAGGQIEGVDFAPTPYKMGKSLTSRVTGLLAPFIDTGTICQ
jgi:hypothetical protein